MLKPFHFIFCFNFCFYHNAFISICLCLTAVRGSVFSNCFTSLIQRSQDCSNNNVTYISIFRMGGMGSEFNTRLIHAVAVAVMENRRVIFLAEGNRDWEYDCDEELLWACYFKLQCPDSSSKVAAISDAKLDNGGAYQPLFYGEQGRYLHPTIEQYIRFAISDYRDENVPFESILLKIFNYAPYCPSENLLNDVSDPLVVMMVIVTNYIYQFNEATQQKIQEQIKPYAALLSEQTFNSKNNFTVGSYVAVHIRLGDKGAEITDAMKLWIKKPEHIYHQIIPYVVETGLNRLLIISEAPEYVENIFKLVRQHYNTTVELYSTSYLPTTDGAMLLNPSHNMYIDRGQRNKNPNSEQKAIAFFADVELLRHGHYFFGLFDSNIVRLVYRLRYPHFEQHYNHLLGAHNYHPNEYTTLLNFLA